MRRLVEQVIETITIGIGDTWSSGRRCSVRCSVVIVAWAEDVVVDVVCQLIVSGEVKSRLARLVETNMPRRYDLLVIYVP